MIELLVFHKKLFLQNRDKYIAFSNNLATTLLIFFCNRFKQCEGFKYSKAHSGMILVLIINYNCCKTNCFLSLQHPVTYYVVLFVACKQPCKPCYLLYLRCYNYVSSTQNAKYTAKLSCKVFLFAIQEYYTVRPKQ